LRLLLTLPLAIVSIIHSGKRGAHALVRGPATTSKEELEEWMDRELLPLTVYGADHNSLRAHKLTRLANVYRAKERQWQSLYYLNPSADGTPICSATFGANSASQNSAEKATNINEGEERVKTEQSENKTRASDGFMSNDEINKLAEEGADLLSFENYCEQILFGESLKMEQADKERAWRTYLAYNVKAKKDGRKSVEYSENSLQKAQKMGERTAEAWQKLLPLKPNVLELLDAWWGAGRSLQKTWSEQTEQTIRGWQQKAARIVELMFPTKGDTPTEESCVSNPFPFEALPPVIKDLAVSIAKTHKSEDKMGVIALPLIGVFSGSLGQGIVVKTKHYISYPNLFVYCSVGSGGIKSVVIDEAEAPVIEFQKIQFKTYEDETKPMALAELRKIEAQIEEMKEFGDDDEEEMSGLAKLYHRKAEEEKKLEFCPVKLDDFTPEAMVMHGINHGRVFISSDEGGIVADILCGRYSKGFTNDGPMCKIWSSSYLSRKRKDGLIWRDRVTGTMVLMGQEHITEQMFQNENMVTSGFIPRLLFATAETPMLYRDKNRPAISEDARNNYRDVVVSVLQKHWIQEDESAPITVGMTDEAQDAIDDFHNSYVDRGNTALSDAKRSLHRIAEQATRIALIFHVAKVYGSMTGLDSDVTDTNEPINLSTVQAAIKVTEWSLQSYLEYSRQGERMRWTN
jgi:hypothetical protein